MGSGTLSGAGSAVLARGDRTGGGGVGWGGVSLPVVSAGKVGGGGLAGSEGPPASAVTQPGKAACSGLASNRC